MLKRVSMAVVVALFGVAAASAQTPQAGKQPVASQQSTSTAQPTGTMGKQPPASQPATSVAVTEGDRRPATTTHNGDTGLWFVPTGEILPRGKWSFSAYRVNFDYNEGFTDVSNFPVTFGVGLGDRAELFGAWHVVRRIDRDVRPIFTEAGGGQVNDYPFVRQGWSDNQMGDLWIGAKINFTSQWKQQPAAFALRGMIKIPTAKDDEEGVGTGKMDWEIDAIVSKEINERVELAGFAGYIGRGSPDGLELSNGFKWGFGAGFPTRKNLQVTAELHGESYLDDTLLNSLTLVAEDGTVAPASTALDSPINASIGLTWTGKKWFAGAGLNYRLAMDGRSDSGPYEDETGDAVGFQLRLGFHPGVRIYTPPPPPPPPVVAPAAPPAVHELSVKAQCNPCTVQVGQTSTVTAFPQSSIGCSVTYAWSSPSGRLTDQKAKETVWTAPMQPGTVPVTVTVTCPQDGKTAQDTVNIQVVAPPKVQITFEDVHFDFDRYSLRPEATRALDEAVKALQADPELNIEIEGHTCNIGTAEYNLALGERRAHAVRDYLTSRGIGANRFRTVSYGEERPKHDNAREETRRLNRRAALVVRVQR